MYKPKSFQRNLFISVGGIFILFALCFAFYQYTREKEYKIDIMQSRLQTYNYEMLQTLGDSVFSPSKVREYVQSHNLQGLRVTIIDNKGKVIADSRQLDITKMANHLQRTEVRQALSEGSGYDIKRESESTHETYFYSATRVSGENLAISKSKEDFVIRAAVPYSATLTKSLEADNTYLYFALALTVLLGFVLYSNTKRVTRHIGYLRQFAMRAEEGEELDKELEKKLPDDELGDISHTIIALYWKLRHSEEDKVRIKRQLTQNAAHELKTPAASIQGYLETIMTNPDMSEEKRQHFLERCYTQSDRMCRLLQDMATLTKLDEIGDNTQEGRKQIAEVDVRQVIDNVLDDTALQLQSKHILPTLNLPDEVKVWGDQSLIYSIFRNLIDNTLAYSTTATKISILCSECVDEEHSGEGSNKLSANQYYEFFVSDNGQGVSPEHLPHLFERFYRVDKGRSRKMGGTGLGLAIVKNAVAAHGGTASAETTPGGGLTIRFTLAK